MLKAQDWFLVTLLIGGFGAGKDGHRDVAAGADPPTPWALFSAALEKTPALSHSSCGRTVSSSGQCPAGRHSPLPAGRGLWAHRAAPSVRQAGGAEKGVPWPPTERKG